MAAMKPKTDPMQLKWMMGFAVVLTVGLLVLVLLGFG
jgi:hypothetical protein